jgi:hypothetical protein
MPIPSTLESLSATIASNIPADGDATPMTSVNDGLRAAYGFIRQALTAGSDIASASTITPPSTGSSFNLTGTTTVTAIASTNAWDGRIVWFRHTGAHAFTNSATLVCLGGASITFASGDISAWRQRTSGTWDQVAGFRADGAFLGDSWNIDTSGRLLNNGNTQPAFRAKDAAGRSTSGTFQTYATEVYDHGSNFNVTTGVFTAPVAGKYQVNYVVDSNVASGTGQFSASVYVNGSDTGVPTALDTSTASQKIGASAVLLLAASDLVRIELTFISGTTPNATVREFSMVLLG